MGSPIEVARRTPDKVAVVVAQTGRSLTYRELVEASSRLANHLRARGLEPGDGIAVLLSNCPEFLVSYWAAMRAGLYFTPIATSLTASEAAYIVNNSGARAFVVDDVTLATGRAMLDELTGADVRIAVGGGPGFDDWAETLGRSPVEAPSREPLGAWMVYSSGSTGRPKGVRRPLTGLTVEEGHQPFADAWNLYFGGSADSIFLNPAPLYHAAPLNFSTGVTSIGGTVVLEQKFDAQECLRHLDEFRVTHAQFVATMFVRFLRLPAEARAAVDLRELKYVLHTGGPCPVEIKRSLIEWLGPVVWEYYAGSEDIGGTIIDSLDWLEHPGSVGRPLPGTVMHICGPDGNDVPVGENGVIYFEPIEGRAQFEYHAEPDKTEKSRHPIHRDWSTLGDIGHLDEDGFLYLVDRKDFMIISGGVNISPREIEDALITDERVLDAAVLGAPDEEYGEQVRALVELAPDLVDGDVAAICEGIFERLGTMLSRVKIPRVIEVVERLPRTPSGKLEKAKLRARFSQPAPLPDVIHTAHRPARS